MRVETLVIGGGQAGLAVSRHLAERDRDHLVLERGRIAESWRSRVWDSFCLVTPNWTVQLPGAAYDGPDPDGFMARDELVAHLVRYAASTRPPLRTGVEVLGLRQAHPDGPFAVATSDGAVEARNVVVAVGAFHDVPRVPPLAADVPSSVLQIHSSSYKNERELPPGAVLVVGAGESGAQIAEELYRRGRRVYLSVGRCRRGPRRYRGRDLVWWLSQLGAYDQVVGPRSRRAGLPHNLQVSGSDGGHDLDLRRFASDGVVLLGRLVGGSGGRMLVAPDLAENLRCADATAAQIRDRIDAFVARTGLAAPEPDVEEPDVEEPVGNTVEEHEPVRDLDLRAAGVATIVWATGYRPDFDWIDLPVTNGDGLPEHVRGITRFPGLYFLGLRFLHTMKSELLLGVGEDAEHVAAHLAARG